MKTYVFKIENGHSFTRLDELRIPKHYKTKTAYEKWMTDHGEDGCEYTVMEEKLEDTAVVSVVTARTFIYRGDAAPDEEITHDTMEDTAGEVQPREGESQSSLIS